MQKFFFLKFIIEMTDCGYPQNVEFVDLNNI